jgi:hypothetical protein
MHGVALEDWLRGSVEVRKIYGIIIFVQNIASAII